MSDEDLIEHVEALLSKYAQAAVVADREGTKSAYDAEDVAGEKVLTPYRELVAEVRKLRDQRDAVLAYTATIECPNCDHPVKFHDNRLGLCDANLNNSLGPCGCDWTSSVAEAIRDRYAALSAQEQTEETK